MTTLYASKYDPNNDAEKPQGGDEIPEEAGGGIVGRVRTVTDRMELLKILQGAQDDPDGSDSEDPFDLMKDPPSRPFVKYLVWKQ